MCYTCTKCGKPIEDRLIYRYLNGYDNEEPQLCEECEFFDNLMRIDAQGENIVVIANGRHYIVDDEGVSECLKGFSGAKFTVKFFDGRIVKTSNLWCQGDIPQVFKAEMPDNAELINGWEE